MIVLSLVHTTTSHAGSIAYAAVDHSGRRLSCEAAARRRDNKELYVRTLQLAILKPKLGEV